MKRAHLARYPLEIFDPIPLHRWNATSKNKKGRKREDGKRPLHGNWTKRAYNSKAVMKRDAEEGLNIGIRLRPSQLVIDVDPRNGGTKGFEDLCNDLLLEPSEWLNNTGVTGSGGLHIYFTKPDDVPVRDTLPDYPGVEFKSVGRQVVAMGSQHPNGKHYVWKTPGEKLVLPKVPRNLLNLITRPQSSALTSGGQIDEEQLATILEELDPTDFGSNDTWQPLMMACHHATAGLGRQAFVDWSISDPAYSDAAEQVGRRWDSCDEEREDGISYKTLNKILRDAGKGSAQIKTDIAGDDFDDDYSYNPKQEIFGPDDSKREIFGDDTEEESTELSPLEKLNEKYTAVLVGGKFRIATRVNDPVMNRDYWAYINDRDFKLVHGTTRIERDTTGMGRNAAETMKLGDAWLEWPKRAFRNGVVFAPNIEVSDKLNLWQGWTMKASRDGSWEYLNELIQEVICDGDAKTYEYVINWLRYLFQFPGRQAETAVVMQGGKGVGKGTLGNIVQQIIGRHALAVASPELITGRFNSHLQDCVFLFADEAIRAHDKAAESRLKNMITEPTIAFEGKGLDVVTGKNVLHVMMATNEDWAVPASMDERRFLVTKVHNLWKGTDKFEKLHKEMGTNSHWKGYRRFLFDMLTPELDSKWHPRQVPNTKQLAEQKLRTLTPMGQWLYNAAEQMEYPFPMIPDKPTRAFYQDVRDSFVMHCKDSNINPHGMNRGNVRFFLQDLQSFLPFARVNLRDFVPDDRTDIPTTKSDGRAASVEFPPITELRKTFEKTLGQGLKWTLKSPVNPEFDFG